MCFFPTVQSIKSLWNLPRVIYFKIHYFSFLFYKNPTSARLAGQIRIKHVKILKTCVTKCREVRKANVHTCSMHMYVKHGIFTFMQLSILHSLKEKKSINEYKKKCFCFLLNNNGGIFIYLLIKQYILHRNLLYSFLFIQTRTR